MSTNVVQMDYEVIQGVSKGFTTASKTVAGVAKLVIALIDVWKSTAFLCPPLIMYYNWWQDNIREKTKQLTEILDEMAQDLMDAIQDHRDGDVAGKSYFGEGV